MKKTLLAAAMLAGFAGVANAQSSVTLYGIVDVGVAGTDRKYEKSTTGLESGIQSGSRWGLRGTEDLGNGLRANFVLESGFNVANGKGSSDGLFNRQAWLGLGGNWGEVRFGRQVTVSSDFFEFTDPFGTGFGQAGANQSFNGNSTNRSSNTVAYISPSYSGFKLGVGYSFNYDGGTASTRDSAQLWSVGGVYENGPLAVGVTYEGTDLGSNTSWANLQRTANGKVRNPYNFQVGGTWDFNVAKVYAAWSQMKNGYTNPSQGDDVGFGIGQARTFGTDAHFAGGTVNAYLVGVSAPIGNGTVLASWQMSDPNNKGAFDGASTKSQQVYSVGYTYGLSKRTNLYAYYSYADRAWFDKNWHSSTYAVGLRHAF